MVEELILGADGLEETDELSAIEEGYPVGYRNDKLDLGYSPIPYDSPEELENWCKRLEAGTYLMLNKDDRYNRLRREPSATGLGVWQITIMSTNAGIDDDENLTFFVTNYWEERLSKAGEKGRNIAIANLTVIPPNSASYNVDETTTRFSGAIWYEKLQTKEVVLAGVGGIGSYIGFLLARMKPARLVIYDDDTVEPANMSGQLYGLSDVGQPKVDALANMIGNYADFRSIISIKAKFTSESTPSDIMICGFDNMKARRDFYTIWLRHVMSKPEEERVNCLFIDGRLAAEELQVLAIQGNDTRAMELYQDKWLFSDVQADATICSYKQTTFMANMIASIMVNIFVNFVANECNPILPRDVPFYTSYAADTMYFKVEM